jgi:hypothetical protein
MRGFAVGSLVLIVLYVALQPGSADRLSEGSGLLSGGFRRLISPDVAGVPARGNWGAAAAATGSPAPTSTAKLPANTPVYV